MQKCSARRACSRVIIRTQQEVDSWEDDPGRAEFVCNHLLVYAATCSRVRQQSCDLFLLDWQKKPIPMKANTQSMTKRASFRVLRTFYVLDGLFKAVRARLRGRVFVCTDLANWHDLQNLMINSDGTITCDCGDVTGEGQLGNLLTEPLEVIYQGAKASAFRQKLREGKLPMIRCIMCPALKETLPGQQPAGSPAPGVKPRICSLSIETTVLCNYNCLGCMRDIIYSHRQKQDLTREELKTVLQRFDGYEISRLFLYNRGEPTLAKDFATELRTIKECFPGTPIYFSTNGSFLDNPHTANAILDYATGVQVSIDGPDQRTAERYQLGIDFSRVLHNLTELVSLRDKLDRDKPAIFWKYVSVLVERPPRATGEDNCPGQGGRGGRDSVLSCQKPFLGHALAFSSVRKALPPGVGPNPSGNRRDLITVQSGTGPSLWRLCPFLGRPPLIAGSPP